MNLKKWNQPVLVNFLLLFTPFIAVVFMGVKKGAYPFILVGVNESMKFGDLQVLMAMADFFRSNSTEDILNQDFSSLNVTPNYPFLLPKILSYLHIGLNQLTISGTVLATFLGLSLSLLFAHLAAGNKFSANRILVLIFGLIFTISSPVLLLIERGNFDSFILIVSIASIYLFYKNYKLIAILLSVFLTLVKIYPIALLIAFYFYKKFKFIFFVPILFCMIYFVINFEQLSFVSSRTPLPDFSWGFGAVSIPAYLIENLDSEFKYFLMAIILLVTHFIGFIVYKEIRKSSKETTVSKFRSLNSNSFNSLLYYSGSIICIFVYLFGTSWDYRLVFFLIPLVAYLGNLEKFVTVDYLYIVLYFLIFYFNFISSWFAVVGDLALIIIIMQFIDYHIFVLNINLDNIKFLKFIDRKTR